jgi:hypothetical protein
MPDGRTLGEVNLEYQATTFNTVTLPFYVTLSPEGEVRSIAEYTTNVERFVDFLNRGLGRQELAAK